MGFNSGFKGLKAQHVSSGTPLIIRSSNYLQPLVYIRMWWQAVVKPEWLRRDYGRSPYAYVNQRLQIQLELLMMSGVPLETCWAFNERWNNKSCYKDASCWLLLLIHTTMHGSMNIKSKRDILSVCISHAGEGPTQSPCILSQGGRYFAVRSVCSRELEFMGLCHRVLNTPWWFPVYPLSYRVRLRT